MIVVTYQLIEKSKEKLIYVYYPEDDKSKKPGKIIVNRYNDEIKVTEIAEIDTERDIPVKEINELIDAINRMEKETGGNDFVEYETESIHSYSYGNHAINDIADKLNSGVVPKQGTRMWY